MNKTKIVFLDAITNNPGDISFDAISGLGELVVYPRTDLSELAERVKEAEIIIVNKFVVDAFSLELMPKVKYIVVAATGYNNIDLKATMERNIPVSNIKGYSAESVTQHVFASLLAILNQTTYYDAQVKEGRWAKSEDFCFYDGPIHELSGLTMGIIGYGTIGKRVGQVATAFGMQVLVHTRTIDPIKSEHVEFVAIDTLLTSSDIISLHCPLTDATKEIINKTNLKKMKSNAVLINTGRGALVNENDLFYALDHGVIRGAALDVLVKEPPHFANPLVNHSKCLVTPHIAWAGQKVGLNC